MRDQNSYEHELYRESLNVRIQSFRRHHSIWPKKEMERWLLGFPLRKASRSLNSVVLVSEDSREGRVGDEHGIQVTRSGVDTKQVRPRVPAEMRVVALFSIAMQCNINTQNQVGKTCMHSAPWQQQIMQKQNGKQNIIPRYSCVATINQLSLSLSVRVGITPSEAETLHEHKTETLHEHKQRTRLDQS